jgi:hypothetical protein
MSDAPKSPGETDLFAHPSPKEFDYKPLLAALRECRFQLVEFMGKTGPRNPVYVEAESLIAYIDAVARLTRIPNAVKFVTRKRDDLRF